MDISRRQLAGMVLAAAASTPAPAQDPPKQQPNGDVEDAKSRQRAGAQLIARVSLPMGTEPAFQFKA